MKRKKILYCESNIDGTIGGSFYSLFYLVDGLDKTVYDPVVVFYQENSLIPMFKDAGIKVEVFELPKPYHLKLFKNMKNGLLCRLTGLIQSGINFYRFLIRQAIRYFVYIRKNNFDLVHLNNTVLRNHNWMLAAKLAGVKCVTHERGINTSFPFLSRFFGKHIDAIICISASVENNLVARGMDFGHLVKIHNGIDPERVQAKLSAIKIREQYGILESDKVIGVVGNIREWKGQEVIVRATAEIKKKIPTIKCLIIGDTANSESSYLERLKTIIKDLDIEENIIFTGYQSNVSDHMNAMDIVVHTSILPEPFGRVLIEAMALSKPLIGSRDGAVVEIIDEGKTGLMFEPGNSADLAQAITSLLEKPEYARELGINGRTRLDEEFHINKNIEKTQNMYQSLFG